MVKVLIADDSIVMRKNLKCILSDTDYEVVAEASNGKQACTQYEIYKPDIVTMDITMPVMDGMEALKCILNKHPEAKIIMISALDQKRMVFEALECGAKHYIIKPVTEEKVLSVLKIVLEQ